MQSNQITELESKRKYYQQEIDKQANEDPANPSQLRTRPFLLNVGLSSNPFLKDQEAYHYMVYILHQYNKRVSKNQVTDPYEALSYQKLLSCLSDLSSMQTKKDQLSRLEQIFKWCKQQQKLLAQRKNQGHIRYKVLPRPVETSMRQRQLELKNERDELDRFLGRNKKQDFSFQEFAQRSKQIPSDLIARLTQPFKSKARTQHPQLDIAPRRLHQYKRKIINIAPFIETKEQTKPGRILFPVPPKFEQQKDQEQEPKEGQQGKEGQQAPKEGQQAPKQGQEVKQDQQQQDLGGFGQEPEQPAEQQQKPEQEGDDKLAPRFKSFIAAVPMIGTDRERQMEKEKAKLYKAAYMNFKGHQNPAERRMEERYLKMQQWQQKRQYQDKSDIEFMNSRGKTKSKVQKELQKKLEQMCFIPNYKLSKQAPPVQEKLNPQDQMKFGFTMPVRKTTRKQSFDLSNNTGLPALKSRENRFTEHSRKDRLHSLKNKFGKMLNLTTDFEQREPAASMCQHTSRRRGLSQIIENHSKSKQRLIQLEQITKIKERFTRSKIGVNIKALSSGLCLPEHQDPIDDKVEAIKQLPSNPFMVEVKKKKKK